MDRKTENNMGSDYQTLVDELFGSNYRHRTLRTVFDPYSTEWTETSIDEKVNILKKILSSKRTTLQDLILSYKKFYTDSLTNKKHVVDSVENALTILLEKAL
jgi:2-oxoglutarate dehydrogenase complex dehydrogenase (E1) component-like enzyme